MKVDQQLVTKIEAALKADSLKLATEAASQTAGIINTEKEKLQKRIGSLQTDIKEIRDYRSAQNPVAISVNLANHFADSLNTHTTVDEKSELKRVQQEYNDGADWLNVCSSVRNGVAALFAFILPLIAARTNRKITHLI